MIVFSSNIKAIDMDNYKIIHYYQHYYYYYADWVTESVILPKSYEIKKNPKAKCKLVELSL